MKKLFAEVSPCTRAFSQKIWEAIDAGFNYGDVGDFYKQTIDWASNHAQLVSLKKEKYFVALRAGKIALKRMVEVATSHDQEGTFNTLLQRFTYRVEGNRAPKTIKS